MSEQRTSEHLAWELHQAALEHDRLLMRIDVLLNRNAALQIELRAARAQSPPQPRARPQGR